MTELAALLLAARQDPSKKLATLPPDLIPADFAAAMVTQQKVAASYSIGGWKVGAPGGGPAICGALPAPGIQPSGTVLSNKTHTMRGIEGEIAFKIAKDLPPRATPYTIDEVKAALGAMHPVIEVLESRFVEPNDFALATNLADVQMHGGLIIGAGVDDWTGIDLSKVECRQLVDGAVDAERTGYPFGDIFALVTWLANTGSVWAGGLKAGQYVTCGSWTGANRVGPNAKVSVAFSGVGVAEVSYG